MSTNKGQRFSIIGCGRLGINLSVFLAQQGFMPAVLCSKSRASAQRAVKAAGAGREGRDPVEAAKAADLVFITTPDTVIEPVCRAVAEAGGFSSGSVVFHLSGALSSSILDSAKQTGAAIGSIHPLQAFAPYEAGQASPFTGINISLEGDDRAVALGQKIVSALGAGSFTIPTRAKVLYHAAAVVASNYLVTLEHAALSLLGEAGLDEKKAYSILEPLIQGTLKNIKARGSVQALTGPVARGDHEVIAGHLADIDGKMPGFSEFYRLLGRHTLDIAIQRGEISGESRDRLVRLFRPKDSN
ncbi:Rossmann-like and DUF2520 domain-containing protein [Desulfospira joergensenii]|uniref:Rossmann-like and DUF2520 domain-containing protein n=1 Tax=Desulfospira joergensenii TaxID=53329 RepID=UPI0003B51C3F|nr:Rossmann-like and DUF2520 domain-containing protein [Desulfospira joergensenii]